MFKFKRFVIAITAGLVLSSASSANESKLNEWNDKWKMVQADSEDLDLQDHWFVCGIKFRFRQYSELFQCLDKLNIRSVKLEKSDWKRVNEPFFSHWIRSIALAELGQFDEALKSANVAISVIQPGVLNGDDDINWDSKSSSLLRAALFFGGSNHRNNPASINFSPTDIMFDLLGKMAVLHHKLGDETSAQKYLSMIEKLGNQEFGWVKQQINKSRALQSSAVSMYAFGEYNKFSDMFNSALQKAKEERTPPAFAWVVVAAAFAFNPVGFSADLVLNTVGNAIYARLADVKAFESELDKISFYFMLASSRAHIGKQDEAEKMFDALIAHKDVKHLGGLYWQLLYERGLIAQKKGDTESAIKYFKESTETIERVRSSISVEAAKIGFSGDKQAVYQDLVKALATKGDWQGAFEYAERAKARALVDMLSQQAKLAPPPAVDEKVLALLERAETLEAPMPILETDGQTRALAIAARKELGKIAPEAASLISVSPVPLSEIATRLAPQETLVNYFNAGDVLYALVMNGTTIKGYKLNAEGLEGEVRAFREGLEASDPKSDNQGRKLYSRLIAPLASELKGKKVTISPHAALHYLPFGALSDGKKYLLETYSLRVMPSANALAYVRTDKPAKAGKILALGNPDLDDPKFDLPAAQQEASQVASLFPASKALVRKDASKAAVKELGSGFSILHIASHGQFDADTPLHSGLLLAGKGVEEGRLTVSDLYTMRLDTELVTLSACETALGKVASGDDVVGLTRGFLYAGARSIVASLWQVDDAATAKLMTAFYKNLAKKIDQREALRLAQVETKKAYPHPFYWAAFQITGAAN